MSIPRSGFLVAAVAVISCVGWAFTYHDACRLRADQKELIAENESLRRYRENQLNHGGDIWHISTQLDQLKRLWLKVPPEQRNLIEQEAVGEKGINLLKPHAPK